MPIYEYKCDRCDKVFEKIQKFIDPPDTVHEVCGGSVVRLISTSALKFKGSGFYITDYKKSGSNGGKSDNPKTGDSSSATKSESKGDSATTTATAPATAPATTSTPSSSTSTESKK